MPDQVDPPTEQGAGGAPDPADAGSNEAPVTDPTVETTETAERETAEREAERETAEPAADSAEAPQPATESDDTEAVDETEAVEETEPASAEAAETAEPETSAETAKPETEEPAAETTDTPESTSTQAPEVTETPAAAAAATPAPDGLRKLLGTARGRPGRGQILVAVLLAVLAFGAVVQGRTVSGSGDYAGARRGDLIQLLDSLDAARDRAESQLRDLQATKQKLENEGTRTQVALREAREEAGTLAILSGTVGATGPGIVIRIDDPDDAVAASTLLNVIEELRDAGAEAIEVNDTARIVAQTYLADANDGISIDGTVVSPPYIIDVIGHPHTLSEAVEFPGGITEVVSTLGGSVEVDESDEVEVTSLAVRREPEYAQPAD
jgi:uncharacterized protein YlxW (UPF0749 family)